MKPVLFTMIRTGPPLNLPGFRTNLNEFHSQLYVNVDPPDPPDPPVPPTSGQYGISPVLALTGLRNYTLVDGTNIFLKEAGLNLNETIPGFYLAIGPWGQMADTVPMRFNEAYSGVVKQICGDLPIFRTVPGEDFTAIYLRWAKTGVKVYYQFPSILLVDPQLDSLVKPSSEFPGLWDTTGLAGQSCLYGSLKRLEEESTQKFFIEIDVSQGNVPGGSTASTLLSKDQTYNLGVSEKLFFRFVY